MARWHIRTRVPVALGAAALLLAGCANPSTGSNTDDPTKPVTLKFWHGWSAPSEAKAIKENIARFEKLHPNIDVVSTGNVSDETINQALRAAVTTHPTSSRPSRPTTSGSTAPPACGWTSTPS